MRVVETNVASKVTKGTKRHKDGDPSDDRPPYLQRHIPFSIAVDTETTGFDWYADDYPFYGTISDYDRDYGYDLTDGEDCKQFCTAVSASQTLIFHNASFDIHMLARSAFDLEYLLQKNIHDTDLLSRIVLGNEVSRFGLKSLATNYLDPDAGQYELEVKRAMVSMKLIRKEDQKESPSGSYYKVWKAYPQILEDYALKDTRYTYDLFYLLMEKATQEDLDVYELERQVLPEVIRMEHKGIRVVKSRVSELHAKHTVLRSQIEEKLNELNGYEDLNPESGEEVRRFLGNHGIQLSDTTESGQIRTDKGILERYKGQEPVDLILDHRLNNKLLTTYLEPMEGREIVHPNFRQIGAWTGRMSSYRPNMQNIPTRSGPEIRSMFVPRDGHAFVVADYSSIELRLLAYYMNDPKLWGIINEGDPFEWMGEQIYGTRDQTQWKVPRQNLKNGTYAIIYGAGGPKLAKTIGGGMSDSEGRALKSAITDTLGGRYYSLQRKVKKAVTDRGYVRTIAGRTQYVPRDKPYVGLNALIQGSAADIMKWAIVKASEFIRALGAYPLLTIHDELVVEAPLTNVVAAQAFTVQGMVQATPLVPMEVESTICYSNYGEAK